jgi:hypothetical protein
LALAVVELVEFGQRVVEAAAAVLEALLEVITSKLRGFMAAVEMAAAQSELSGLDAFVHSQITIQGIYK